MIDCVHLFIFSYEVESSYLCLNQKKKKKKKKTVLIASISFSKT